MIFYFGSCPYNYSTTPVPKSKISFCNCKRQETLELDSRITVSSKEFHNPMECSEGWLNAAGDAEDV